MSELNELRKLNADLEKKLADASKTAKPKVEGLAGLDESITIYGTDSWNGHSSRWDHTLTWGELFTLIAPYLLQNPSDRDVRYYLDSTIYKLTKRERSNRSIDDQAFQTVKIQLMALGLVGTEYAANVRGVMTLFWSLTPAGKTTLFQLRTVKSEKSD